MLVDVFIVILLITALLRGKEIGFVRQLFSTIGFLAGLWLGILAGPHVVQFLHTQLSRSIVILLIAIGSTIIFLAIGEYLGISVKQKLYRLQINVADNILGSGLAMLSALLAIWLFASILLSLPFPGLKVEVRKSQVVSFLNRTLPPAPNIIAGLGHLIDPNGFPKVFTGLEPAPPANVSPPSLNDFQVAIVKDENSVVKIEGQGCGGIVEGSGFVVGSDLVATNAHVVAGINQPYVTDHNGNHRASVIWFDPNLDFAVLRVSNLAGQSLFINTNNISPNTAAVFLGYPGGGDFSANPALVLDQFTAIGRNIYNQGATTRDVYEMSANVVPGNSGGPLIEKDGSVIGIVFAQSTSYNQIGYALSTPQVVQEINQAQAQDRQVNTGNCAQ